LLAGPAALAIAGCASPLSKAQTHYVSQNYDQPAAPSAPPAEPTATAEPGFVTYVAQSAPAKQVDHLELPLRLAVPRIGIDGLVVAVGLTRDGAMDVPQRPEDVGWYQYSARPGMKGNAVMAGHLNWYGKDGVFRRLAELGPGDSVVVRAADGEEREYGVEWHQEWPLTAAPVGKIFEPLESPALTLITCGGRWNPATQLYDTRVVIRAKR
jgi:sortase (surface protein transpeptidase)